MIAKSYHIDEDINAVTIKQIKNICSGVFIQLISKKLSWGGGCARGFWVGHLNTFKIKKFAKYMSQRSS